jgi:hypothetical protein
MPAVLAQEKRDGLAHEEIAARLCVSVCIARKYLSQARALIRTFGIGPLASDALVFVVGREEILAAQAAAAWLVQIQADQRVQTEEFLLWLRQRPLHVRELLLALAWDSVLDRAQWPSSRDC